ncbi:MAG: sugar kinase [Anaerolineae bacterium]
MPSIIAVGEALVEIMRTGLDQPLDRPGTFAGPFPSGAPVIFADAAARLGADVGMVATVGDDAFGHCIADRLRDDGLDLRAFRMTDDRLTGMAFVSYRSDGGRSFLFHLRDAAAADVTMAQVPPGYLDGVRHLHITGSSLSTSPTLRETCYELCRCVHGRGGTISLDPNLRPELMPVEEIRAICQPVLDLATYVLPSGAELMGLVDAASTEDAAAELLRHGVELVALKRGVEGATLFGRHGRIDVAPFGVTEVDPTGAGDCYAAGLITALLRGWELGVAGALANAVGALATTRQGPMEGTFSLGEVAKFMAEQGRPLPGGLVQDDGGA